MSTTTHTPPPAEPRPWHTHENPFEALFQHFTAEIAALKAQLRPATPPPAPPVAATPPRPAAPAPVPPAAPAPPSATE